MPSMRPFTQDDEWRPLRWLRFKRPTHFDLLLLRLSERLCAPILRLEFGKARAASLTAASEPTAQCDTSNALAPVAAALGVMERGQPAQAIYPSGRGSAAEILPARSSSLLSAMPSGCGQAANCSWRATSSRGGHTGR